jgi:hypothetical protein
MNDNNAPIANDTPKMRYHIYAVGNRTDRPLDHRFAASVDGAVLEARSFLDRYEASASVLVNPYADVTCREQEALRRAADELGFVLIELR